VASALAIERGHILGVGSDQAILSEFGEYGSPIDLEGRIILPGLTDAHIHLEQYALGLQKVDCETPTKASCLERVAERVRSTPPGEWVLGHGWNQNDWPEGFGTAADLDSVAPDHPVYLTAKSLHAAWANSAAFRLAGITLSTSDPPGGRIQRAASGEPSGILYEAAMSLVSEVIPSPTPESVAEAIHVAQERLWRMGLTGLHDFDRQTCFTALQILHESGNLHLRVLKSIPLEALPDAVGLGLRSGFGDDWLRIGSVKIFSDGALGPRTAAMLQPYEGEPENQGILLVDSEGLFEHGRLAVDNGLSLAVHAIGDRANHEVLMAFKQLRSVEGQAGAFPSRSERLRRGSRLRHRIEHVQIIHPSDAPLLAELDVIASMQPIHATSDFPAADRFWGQRSANSYAWRTLLDYGTNMAFGSDAPVESPNPFWGIHAAVTRQRHDGSPGPSGWYPGQRLSRLEALQGFTTGAAFTSGMENRLGRLSPGLLADLLILESDPMTCEADQIKDIHPVATMVNGEWVFCDLSING
jgi:predicted amidohydrolase YtcJ